MKSNRHSRRRFIGQAGGAALVATGLLGRTALAGAHLPKVDPNDNQAKALGYVHESTTEGQKCNNCQLWKGGDKAWGACAIFPDKEVAAQGWCKSWIKMSG